VLELAQAVSHHAQGPAVHVDHTLQNVLKLAQAASHHAQGPAADTCHTLQHIQASHRRSIQGAAFDVDALKAGPAAGCWHPMTGPDLVKHCH
jgi:hypothetical protein